MNKLHEYDYEIVYILVLCACFGIAYIASLLPVVPSFILFLIALGGLLLSTIKYIISRMDKSL